MEKRTMDNTLIFFQSPQVTMATNTFINTPVILQYEDIRLVEVLKVEKAGFTTQIPIYHPDGTFVKCPDDLLPTLFFGEKEKAIHIIGKTFTSNTFTNLRIGIWIRKDG